MPRQVTGMVVPEGQTAGRAATRPTSAAPPVIVRLAVWGLLVGGCAARDAADAPVERGRSGAMAHAPLTAASEAAIRRFCGDCHALPLPSSFPRDRWPREVRQGYDLALKAGRGDLVRPVERDAIRFFAAAAPERLVVPRAADSPAGAAPVRFVAAPLPPSLARVDPAIAHVRGEADGTILTTDMRHGEVSRWRPTPAGWTAEVIARSDHPCRVVPVEAVRVAAADSAPRPHLLADLGSFLPEDHAAGAVLACADDGTVRRLVHGLSRVVEARWCDFDDDGRDDLIVAEFGWVATGALRVFLARAPGDDAAPPPTVADPAGPGPPPAEAPGYREIVLDPRHGALGVRLADLDGDGRDDIVAAFAQEHETVDVWWNRGGGRHEHQTLLRLPDPSYGSSSFEVADLDGDGRLDILHANGDTMDSGLAKPYHGIRRILNRGSAGFIVEELTTMVGVCQATAADLDLDGDLDIVAASLHPAAHEEPAGTFDSLLWLEQLPDGSYARHAIERDRCEHAAFAVADVDADGRPDLVVGCWRAVEDGQPHAPLSVFLNRAAGPAAAE
jgi:hypothetical protein